MCSMQKGETTVWFGFELNRLQSVLLFILALIGLLNIPFGILQGINQFLDILFLRYPYHLANPALYTIYYIFDDIKNATVTLGVYTIFFMLCLYTIRKIVGRKKNSTSKKKLSQDHITNWFGFKLNHSQSIFLFALSVIGIISITASFLYGLNRYPSGIFFSQILPPDYLSVQRVYFNLIHLIIFIITLYTLIKMKIHFPRKSVGINTPTYRVIVFIISVLIIIFILPRLLYIFSSLIHEISIIGEFSEFGLPLITLIVCSNIISFLLLRKPRHNAARDSSLQKPFLKFTPKIRFIILTLSIFGFIINFAIQFKIIMLGSITVIYGFLIDLFGVFFNLLLLNIPFLVIFSCFFKKGPLEHSLNDLDYEINKKWFGRNFIFKIYAIVLYWISLPQIVYFALELFYNYWRFYDLVFGLYGSSYETFKFILYLIIVCIVFAFCVYNLIKFHKVQKTNVKLKFSD